MVPDKLKERGKPFNINRFQGKFRTLEFNIHEVRS